MTHHLELDPTSPIDRRVELALKHLDLAAADVGLDAIDALRQRLRQSDASLATDQEPPR